MSWIEGPTSHFASDLYARFYKEADRDNDGFITFEDLKRVCSKYRFAISEPHLWYCFTEPNMTKDYNRLSYSDFMYAMGLVRGERDMVAQVVAKPPEDDFKMSFMKQIFKMFDKDGNGEIDKEELKAVFEDMGKKMTDAQVMKMISVADKNRSGSLNYDEFVEVLTKEGLASSQMQNKK